MNVEKITSFLKEKNGKEIFLSSDGLKEVEELADAKYRNKELIVALPGG